MMYNEDNQSEHGYKGVTGLQVYKDLSAHSKHYAFAYMIVSQTAGCWQRMERKKLNETFQELTTYLMYC